MKITKVNFWLKNLFLILFMGIALTILYVPGVSADSLWDKQIGMGTESDQVGYVFDETTTDRNDVTDIRVALSKIIRVFLGFMGIIFLILIIYGGFMWMTAAGNDDGVNKAKSILISGVIGLIIVLASFAIATLVTDKLIMATQKASTVQD